MKESGIGREGSSYGIDEWLELKYWAIGGIGGACDRRAARLPRVHGQAPRARAAVRDGGHRDPAGDPRPPRRRVHDRDRRALDVHARVGYEYVRRARGERAPGSQPTSAGRASSRRCSRSSTRSRTGSWSRRRTRRFADGRARRQGRDRHRRRAGDRRRDRPRARSRGGGGRRRRPGAARGRHPRRRLVRGGRRPHGRGGARAKRPHRHPRQQRRPLRVARDARVHRDPARGVEPR